MTTKPLSPRAIGSLACAAKYQRGEYRPRELGGATLTISNPMWCILVRAGLVHPEKVMRSYAGYPIHLLTDAGYDFLEAQGL